MANHCSVLASHICPWDHNARSRADFTFPMHNQCNKYACRCVPRASARRDLLLASGSSIAVAVNTSNPGPAHADDQGSFVNMEALKGKDYGKSPMKFTDYETTPSGVQYKDLRIGTGASSPCSHLY